MPVRVCKSVCLVWGAWAWGFPGATRPTAFCVFVRERERARVSRGVTAGSCPALPPLSVWVSLHLPRAIVSGSLYGLLTRFCELTLPRVRFAPVWLSTGRTARLAWVWWGVVTSMALL